MADPAGSARALEAAGPFFGLALAEAWTSWLAGSAGVGAVVVAEDGQLLARGRNAMFEPPSPDAPLAGTYMAHAEMAALARLPVGDYRGCALYSTFEPCAMCAATIRMYRIGTLHYASADPVWDGLHDAFMSVPAMARRLPERVLLGGPIGVFGHVLHLVALHDRAPEYVLSAHERLAPNELALARRLHEDGRLMALQAAGSSVAEAIEAIWPELVASAGPTAGSKAAGSEAAGSK